MTASAESSRRVFITGIGLHCALGDETAVWAALSDGQSALRPTALPQVNGFPTFPGAPFTDFPVAGYLRDRKLAKYMNPATQAAVVAAARALKDAQLQGENLDDTALYVATGLTAFDLGAVSRALDASKADNGTLDLIRLGEMGLGLCHPLMPFRTLLNMPIGMVSIALGLRGENAIYYPSVGQAGVGLERALRGIKQGRFPRALVGATAQQMSLMPVCTMLRADQLASGIEAAQPFSPQHRGYAPADGASFLVLEAESAAQQRQAQPLAELHVPAIDDTEGSRAREELWLEAAGKAAPDLVWSTGSSGAAEDDAQLRAASRCWDRKVGLACADGALGYLGPAALPFGIALAARVMHRGELPPAIHFNPRIASPRTVLVSALDADRSAVALRVTSTAERG